VVIIEQQLGLISFRPIFKVHKLIPWLGLIGSVLAMFIINPTISLVSWATVLVVYAFLSKQKLESKFEDVRSGLFTSFSEWAAKRTTGSEQKQERAWKPNLLVPVTEASTVQGSFSIIKNIAHPEGSAIIMGIGEGQDAIRFRKRLLEISRAFKNDNLFSSMTIMKTNDFASGVNYGNQALGAAFFRPNIIFLTMLERESSIKDYPKIIMEARRLNVGVILFMPHKKAMLGQRQYINIWVRNTDPEKDIFDFSRSHLNSNLALLISYKLKLNWKAEIRLIKIVRPSDDLNKERESLNEFINMSRLPISERIVKIGNFFNELENAPEADLNIFGISPDLDMEEHINIARRVNSSCMFIMDSGKENIFA